MNNETKVKSYVTIEDSLKSRGVDERFIYRYLLLRQVSLENRYLDLYDDGDKFYSEKMYKED